MFIRFANSYQRFIHDFNRIATLFTSILRISFISNVKTLPKADDKSSFLILNAKLTFMQLRQVFTQAFSFYHFGPEYYVCIKTDIFDYTIDGILNKLILESE